MDNEYFWETRTALEKSSYSSPPPPHHHLATHLTKNTYIHILASNIFYFEERYKNNFTLKKNFQVKRVFWERGGGVTGKEWTSNPPLKIVGSALGDIHIHCSSYTTKYLQSRQRSNLSTPDPWIHVYLGIVSVQTINVHAM